MPESWYEVVAGRELEQADILARCPIPRVTGVQWPIGESLQVELADVDLIVLTQSCDLVSDKVDEVLLATVRTYNEMCATDGQTNTIIRGRQWRKALQQGDLNPYCLLQCRDAAPVADWSIVDFHHLFSLPKPYLEDVAEQQGDRLRLVAPYREHVAQAFARYMMRVGLPTTLQEFEAVKPA